MMASKDLKNVIRTVQSDGTRYVWQQHNNAGPPRHILSTPEAINKTVFEQFTLS
jgi:hypothetical protein